MNSSTNYFAIMNSSASYSTIINPTNSSAVANASCVQIDVSPISDLLMAIYIMAFILGVVFHLTTLGPIVQQVSSHNVLGVYLLSLSLSDLFYISTMPLWIYYYRMDHKWVLGEVSCSVAGFIYYSNMYVSIYLLCCISVDRCLAVTFPLHAKVFRRNRYAWAICGGVVLLIMGAHTLILKLNTDSPLHAKTGRCYENYPMTLQLARFNLIRVGLGFLAPLLLLALCYTQIFRKVRQSYGIKEGNKRKVKLLSMGVIAIFSICFAPYHILLLLRSVVFILLGDDSCVFEQSLHFFFSGTLALSSLNSVVDPLLYVLVSNGVKDDMRLCCWWGNGASSGSRTASSPTQLRTRFTSLS
ncbi:G-protein coupled receptor 4-like [Megalops cyprinoides]|uniref:G-protein coupled receptor 4-like n=1 Tax=Megalops cyprinoides TaxID=118141 RepID=UPI00186443B7|nr:G-protein coupled receptor 4-like [Megalops cyprinoides]